jgi:thiol-disulfide isomerase/thioredoxin
MSTIMLIRSYSQVRPTGGMADYSWTMRSLDGEVVTLSKYAGKPIFLNIWATWCGPCMQEMPSIAKLANNPNLKDVVFLCVATDESPRPVQAYVDAKRPPMTILHANGSIPKVFFTEGIPATFLIAPDGRIVKSQVGSSDWDQPDVIRLLESLQRDAK